MANHRAARTRFCLATVSATLVAALLTYRRRAMVRRADEFHQRYG
jgi:hypothetical protein